MMAQRPAQEIISLILQSAENGATKTVLMYDTYLANDTLKEYLALLVERGLIEYLVGGMKFRTTVKGQNLLSSATEAGDLACGHQCNKCGVLYHCKQTRCQDPFQHAACNQCLQFHRPQFDVVDKVRREIIA